MRAALVLVGALLAAAGAHAQSAPNPAASTSAWTPVVAPLPNSVPTAWTPVTTPVPAAGRPQPAPVIALTAPPMPTGRTEGIGAASTGAPDGAPSPGVSAAAGTITGFGQAVDNGRSDKIAVAWALIDYTPDPGAELPSVAALRAANAAPVAGAGPVATAVVTALAAHGHAVVLNSGTSVALPGAATPFGSLSQSTILPAAGASLVARGGVRQAAGAPPSGLKPTTSGGAATDTNKALDAYLDSFRHDPTTAQAIGTAAQVERYSGTITPFWPTSGTTLTRAVLAQVSWEAQRSDHTQFDGAWVLPQDTDQRITENVILPLNRPSVLAVVVRSARPSLADALWRAGRAEPDAAKTVDGAPSGAVPPPSYVILVVRPAALADAEGGAPAPTSTPHKAPAHH